MKLNGEFLNLWRMENGRIIWKREVPKCLLVLEGKTWVPVGNDISPEMVSAASPLTGDEILYDILWQHCVHVSEDGKPASADESPPTIDFEGWYYSDFFHKLPPGTKIVGVGCKRDVEGTFDELLDLPHKDGEGSSLVLRTGSRWFILSRDGWVEAPGKLAGATPLSVLDTALLAPDLPPLSWQYKPDKKKE